MPRRRGHLESSWRRRRGDEPGSSGGNARDSRACRMTATSSNRNLRRGSSSRQPPIELGVLLEHPQRGHAELLRRTVEMLPDTSGQIRFQRDSYLVGPETKLADLVVAKGNRNDRHRRISLGPAAPWGRSPAGLIAWRNTHQPERPAGD